MWENVALVCAFVGSIAQPRIQSIRRSLDYASRCYTNDGIRLCRRDRPGAQPDFFISVYVGRGRSSDGLPGEDI